MLKFNKMKELNLNGFKIFKFEKLENRKGIFCAVTTKKYKNESKFNFLDYDVKKNNLFKRFSNSIGSKNYFYMRQSHTSNIFLLKDKDIYTKDNIDGVITDIENKLLIGFSADCSLSLFYDSKNKALGLCHAGWRGAFLNIYSNMLKNMTLHFNTDKKDLFVGIGPFISEKNYEVKYEIIKKFEEIYGYKTAKKFYSKIKNEYFLSLRKILSYQLKELGIKNYEFADLCTYKNNDLFYSYRKGDKGHFIMCAEIRAK